jgi:hypothetical protein
MSGWKFVTLLVLALVGVSHSQTEPKIHQFATAIARTEGFYIRGTIPSRLHNPGDIMTNLRHAYPGQVSVYHHYAVFRSDAWGWAALEDQIRQMLDGNSTKYNSSMTIVEVARVYAENWRYWSRTVSALLHIDPSTTLDEYFGLAPKVRMIYVAPVWMQFRGDTVPEMLPVLAMPPQIHRETGRIVVETMSEWCSGENQ